MLTKKRMVLLTIMMSIGYFAVIWFFLPESVVGPRSERIYLLMAKVAFLGATAAFTTAIVLVILYKKEFIRGQIYTFNKYKNLLFLLVRRDFVTRYRRSTLGILWSMLNPLLTMLVMTFVFSFIFRNEIEYFPVYLLSGQLIFSFFSESTNAAMHSIVRSSGIIKKIYVPKYIFPMSRVVSSLVNLFFSFLAFLLVFIIIRAPFHWTFLLIFIPITYTFIFSLGVGMILSSLSVFFRDLDHLYGVFTLLLMYLSAIFYPVTRLPEQVQLVLGLNPMYHYISYMRHLVLYGNIPGFWANAVCLGFAMAALCCGVYTTMAQQDKYILYL